MHKLPSIHQNSNPDHCEVTKSSHSVICTDHMGRAVLVKAALLHSVCPHYAHVQLLACDNGQISFLQREAVLIKLFAPQAMTSLVQTLLSWRYPQTAGEKIEVSGLNGS